MKLKVTEKYVQTSSGERKLRYYTEVDHCGKISKDHFVDVMRNNKCIPTLWTLAVLEATSDYIMEMTKEGHVVEVPFLGLFKLMANGRTTDEKSQAGRKAIEKLRLNFKPTTDLLRAIEQVQIQS